MNQDDSIVTPAPETGGRTPFELGDYRYALNLKIGSSRGSNFNDGETIKDTVEVTDYMGLSLLAENPNFTDGLTNWAQTGSGSIWTSGVNKAVFTYVGSGTEQSKIIYQTIDFSIAKSTVLAYTLKPSSSQFLRVYAIFLNGTTILKTVEIFASTLSVQTDFKKILSIPNDTTAIGIYVLKTSGSGTLELINLDFTGFSSISAPTDVEKTVGRYNDFEFLRTYYINYNYAGDHTLRMYDKSTNKIYELLKWSGLNVTEKSFVKMAKLDNWLAFTDRANAPRLVDCDSIYNLKYVLGSEFREFHISHHKWAPTSPALVKAYYDGSTNNWTKLRYKTLQFAYRYIYKGQLRSRWSPISKAAFTSDSGDYYAANTITSIQLDIPGFFLDQPGANVEYNYFNHSNIKFLQAVDYIEIAFREGELDLWKLWKRQKVNEYDTITAFTHYFDGKFNGAPVDLVDFEQAVDNVPLLAGTVEAIDNRFVYGDCLGEEDPITDFAVESISTVTDPSEDWDDSAPSSWSTIANSARRIRLQRTNALNNFNMKATGLYKVGLVFKSTTGYKSLVYTNDNWVYELSDASQVRLHAFNFKISDHVKPPKWATSYEIVRTNVLNVNYFMHGIANGFTPLLDSANQLIGLTSLPDNIKNRISEHFENSNMVDGYEVAKEIQKEERQEEARQKFLNTKLPGRLTRSLGNYLLTNSLASKTNSETRLSVTTQSIVGNCSRIFIDLNNWYNAAKETTTKDRPLSKLFYNFRKGDRVKFKGFANSSPTVFDTPVTYDLEILEFTGTGIIVERPSDLLGLPSNSVGWLITHHDIQIYTPQIPDKKDYVFYETGEWYPILYPGTESRDFSKRDWVYTNNTAVTDISKGDFDIFGKMPFFYGDCCQLRKSMRRDFVSANGSVGTSMNPDPDYTFAYWERANGRPNIAYEVIPVVKFKPTQLRFGGRIVEESTLNQINRFKEADQYIYPSEYGRIRALGAIGSAQVESVGTILLAIGEREAWSIYVNRTTLEDLSGRTQLALSDKVLGSYNTLLGSQGTLNPESFTIDQGRAYWWNAVDGNWVRYSRDGLTKISEYKMRTWFRELNELVIDEYNTSSPPQVISEFDSFNEELVTFQTHANMPSTFRDYDTYKGMVFSESEDRWKRAHSYTPDLMGRIANLFLIFKAGKLYKHEAGESYLTFFGTKYDAMIEPAFNLIGSNMKVWQSISIVSTNKWSVDRFLSENRGLKQKQESRILLESFEIKEDTYYASIKNDLNTPNGGPNSIVDGNKMRSKAIQALLKLDPSVVTLSLLHYVIISAENSPKNPIP